MAEIGSVWKYNKPLKDGDNIIEPDGRYKNAFLFEIIGYEPHTKMIRISNRVSGDRGWFPDYLLDSMVELKDYKDDEAI